MTSTGRNGVEPVRWGIAGGGGIARKFADSLRTTGSGSLVAVGARSLGDAEAFAARDDGVRAHGGYDALMRDDGVDAVYIATIHPTHKEIALAAIAAGKACLIEKPIALTAADAAEIFEAAERAGVFVMEAFMYRLHPMWLRLEEIVRSGALGTVRFVEGSFGFPTYEDDVRARLVRKDLGGGGILDIGCYPVSAIRAIAMASGIEKVGPDRVACGGEVGGTGVDQWAAASVFYDGSERGERGGMMGVASCSIRSWLPNRVTVTGDLGGVEIEHPWHGTGVQGGTKTIRIWDRPDRSKAAVERTEEVVCEDWLYAIEAEHVARMLAMGRVESDVVTRADTMVQMDVLDRWRHAAGYWFEGEARSR